MLCIILTDSHTFHRLGPWPHDDLAEGGSGAMYFVTEIQVILQLYRRMERSDWCKAHGMWRAYI